MQAVRVYYFVLDRLLASEEAAAVVAALAPQAARAAATTWLLTSAKFHKGLMACALELVIATYRWVRVCQHQNTPFANDFEFLACHYGRATRLVTAVQYCCMTMQGTMWIGACPRGGW
jgi:hypothetical protein